MIREAKAYIDYVELSTNGNIVKKQDFFESLVVSGLDCINIAVTACYRIYMQDTVTAGI